MKFRFKDIDNPKLYDGSQVVFVTGQYPIFINIVVDMLKDTCRIAQSEEDVGLLDEFGVSDTDPIASNSVDFETFLEVSKMPNINGRWVCSTDLNSLTKRQRESLQKYIKSPSRHGLLIITSTEFKEYAPYLKDRTVNGSQYVHLIQLSFPSRQKLLTIVHELFHQRGVEVDQRAAELFIMRMSASYNEYIDIMERNVVQMVRGQGTGSIFVDYPTMVECLKGVENFVLEDFLLQLTVPLKKDKIVKNRRLYKMVSAMINEYGAKQLVYKLRRKVDDIIEMRMAINSGYVPIGVKYSVEESQRRLGEEHPLNKLSEYAFRKLATLASQSSLKDWVSIKTILLSVNERATEAQCEKVIHTIVNRSIYSDSRLLNNVEMQNIIESELFEVNKKPYLDRPEQEETGMEVRAQEQAGTQVRSREHLDLEMWARKMLEKDII